MYVRALQMSADAYPGVATDRMRLVRGQTDEREPHAVVKLPSYRLWTFDALYLQFCGASSMYKGHIYGENRGFYVRVISPDQHWQGKWGFGVINNRQDAGCMTWLHALYHEHAFVLTSFAFRSSDGRDMADYVERRDWRLQQPPWMTREYPQAAAVLEKPREWDRDPTDKACVLSMCRAEWVRMRNMAYAASVNLHNALRDHYLEGIHAAGTVLSLCPCIWQLVAAYAVDLPFDTSHSAPVLTVEECTPAVAH